MKIFQTKSILFAIATALVVVSSLPILQSCSNDNETEIKAEYSKVLPKKSVLEITDESIEFKQLVFNSRTIANLSRNANIGIQKAPSENGERELEKQMLQLTKASMKMFKSYGVEYKDIAQYVDNENDPRIAIMGMIFVAFQKEGIDMNKNKTGKLKTKRFKTNSNEETISYGKVIDCIGRAFTGISISEFAFGSASYFSLATIMGIAGRVASRTLGVVGAAIAIADFGDCLGFYDIW